jgi:hypothetical protein
MNSRKKVTNILLICLMLPVTVLPQKIFLHKGDLAVCKAPVASLWSEPNPSELGKYQAEPARVLPPLPLLGCVHVPHHVTQLLYGERVIVRDDLRTDGWINVQTFEQYGFNPLKNDWCYVGAWMRGELLQPVTHFKQPNVVVKQWWATVYAKPDETSFVLMHIPFASLLCGCRYAEVALWYRIELYDGRIGFMAATELAEIPSHVKNTDSDAIRADIITFAQAFAQVKSPYLWGGRSPFNDNGFDDVVKVVGSAASVDCSGLVDVVHRACGIQVPRNSYAQYLRATPVDPSCLQPGDLIFLEITNAAGVSRICHVLIYIGTDATDNAMLVEATGGDAVKEKCTRVTTTHANFGIKNFAHITNGQIVGRFENGKKIGSAKVYCRTFLHHRKLQEMRNALLSIDEVMPE